MFINLVVPSRKERIKTALLMYRVANEKRPPSLRPMYAMRGGGRFSVATLYRVFPIRPGAIIRFWDF